MVLNNPYHGKFGDASPTDIFSNIWGAITGQTALKADNEALVRQQQQQAARSAEAKEKITKYVIWGVAGVAAIAVVGGGLFWAKRRK